MKRTTLVLTAITLVTLVILSGCDLFGTSPTDRLESFIADANAATRVNTDLQSHFSPDVSQRSSMTTDTFWDVTFFAFEDRPFTLGTLTEGVADPSYAGSRVFTSTLSTGAVSGASLRAVFVQDGFDWLIRELTADDGTEDTIQSVTPAGMWSFR